ncbi:unnamed protein product [Didymodactylos carnosus]|uniref:Phospholipase n=1 Tax=Didymodactylos carnosus TaxID=1234261 RepID=A0A8S2I6F5_9BILA|nr:unnamed protein product [Didymodactylos carnosus]CAF3696568.1 unnamed protein product [Didymodactylos carnosus]
MKTSIIPDNRATRCSFSVQFHPIRDDDIDDHDSSSPLDHNHKQNGIRQGDEMAQKWSASYIPYMTYFEDRERPWSFIANSDVFIVAVNVSREHHFRLNPFLYTIKLKHGCFDWTISKRYKDLVIFFERMNLFQKTASLPLPTTSHREIRRQMSHSQTVSGLTLKPDVLVDDGNIVEREKLVAEKLTSILNHPVLSTHIECLKFVETCPLSFIQELGRKYKEGVVKKHSGGYRQGCCENVIARMRWFKRWFIIKDTWIGYLNPKTGIVRAVMLVDHHFHVRTGRENTGSSTKLYICNLARRLYVECGAERKATEFCEDINRMLKTTGYDFHIKHRFNSFAPVRTNSKAQWLVEGADYMEAVAYAIKAAKEEIYITDWFLSPEIYLKRPALSDEWRFDKMLQKKAHEGVRIFVLLYKEVELALGINSSYSKRKLIETHPDNVKVLRYPDHTGQNAVLFWGHHEKLVIVDQSIALFGGLDLCYGRWDNYFHLLTDYGSALPMKHNKTQSVPRTNSVPDIKIHHVKSVIPLEALDLDRGRMPLYQPYRPPSMIDDDHIPHIDDDDERPTPTTVEKEFKPNKVQFHSEYCLKDRLKDLVPSSEVPPFVPTPKRSLSKVLSDQTFENSPKLSPNRRFSSGDISIEENNNTNDQTDHQQEQKQKRRIYNYNHHLFSNIYKRTHRLSSSEQRHNYHQRLAESLTDDDDPSNRSNAQTSDSAYVRALEQYHNHTVDASLSTLESMQTIASLTDPDYRRPSYNTTLSVPSGKFTLSYQKRHSENLIPSNTSAVAQNLHADNVSSHNQNRQPLREKKLSLLSPRRRSHFVQAATLSDEQKRKRDVIWPLKRSFSFDNTFQRDTIEELNKDKESKWQRLKIGLRDTLQTKILRFTKSNEDVSTLGLGIQPPSTPLTPLTAGIDRERFRDKIRRVTLSFKTSWKQSRSDSDIDEYETQDINDMNKFFRSSNDLGLQGSSKLWFGKDYANFLLRDFRNLDQPFIDIIDRNTTPRMPWHDIGGFIYGAGARDLSRHFQERWNFIKRNKVKDDDRYPFLLPKAYGNYTPCPKLTTNAINCSVQALRSVGKWSTGINENETSIQNAFIDMITNAKYYVYIEVKNSQFFISLVGDSVVRNGIADALFKRIIKAHQDRETFRVYIVMPLMPGFEGQYGSSKATALQAITHWNYRSISQGQQSLLARLSKEVGDVHKYICFFGLRTWSEMSDQLVSEIVYVHSKLIIVDDSRVLIGSANVNDRSLLGDRDSEVSVIFDDIEFVRGTMNGENVQVGKFGSSLRKRLFREHLGDFDGTQIDYSDPICDAFYKDIWLATAGRNTTMFEKIFNCIPTDSAFTFVQLREIQAASKLSQTNPDEARRLLTSVRGYLVLIPHKFLCKEYLAPRMPAKEILAPVYFWT